MAILRVLKKILKWGAIAVAALLLLGAVGLFIGYWMSDNECSDPNRPAPKTPMKAIVYCEYGGPEVLKVETVEKPAPGDDQVLVKVRAVSVNPFDWHYLRGEPYIMRLDGGLRKPQSIRLGVDFSGVVEAVGKNVTQFKPGDAVFGGRVGAFAEYVVTRATSLGSKPENISFEQAAAVNIAARTALQALRENGKVQPGQKVLINGASGGVGTFAVQIAKNHLGANVAGVSSTRNVELVRSLGADRVFDYTKEDFTQSGEQFDAIVDNVGNRGLSEYRRVLKPEGNYVMVGGEKGRWLAPMDRVLVMAVYAPFVSQHFGMMLTQSKPEDLKLLSELMAAGKVTPVIDRTYQGMGQIPEAIRYLEEGRARGKVVVTLE